MVSVILLGILGAVLLLLFVQPPETDFLSSTWAVVLMFALVVVAWLFFDYGNRR